MKKMQYRPSREIELKLLHEMARNGQNVVLAGVDEVGRGALAGPVSVGIALVNLETSAEFPEKLRDSKQISPKVREALVAPCKEWVLASAVGFASAAQIDQCGIIGGLRLAAHNAFLELRAHGYQISGILLDGVHDWWTSAGLFDRDLALPDLPVETVVKGDARCAVIAAASVLAKVERDAYMQEISAQYPAYDWANNKGYASAKHIAALAEYGPSEFHRVSWKLPGKRS